MVTGERLRDLRAALEACLARNCPPDEDVNASLAVAEAEFLNGEYERAQRVIGSSLDRNRRHAARYPEPVSSLWRSQARVQMHRGRDPQALYSMQNVLRSLREGLPVEDYRHFGARLEIVELLLRSGSLNSARRELDQLIDLARRAGRNDIARWGEMRRLRIAYLLNPGDGPALRQLEQLAAETDPARSFEALAARLFLARIYRARGDTAASDRMLAGIPRRDADRRQLLYSPPYVLLGQDPALGGRNRGLNTLMRLPENYAGKWIDLGYWIQPDGRVGELEIVRQGASTEWAEPLLASIRGRIYAPSSDGSPSYRLERYTYTAPYEQASGSRLLTRSPRARVEFLDLTSSDEPGRAPDAAPSPQER